MVLMTFFSFKFIKLINQRNNNSRIIISPQSVIIFLIKIEIRNALILSILLAAELSFMKSSKFLYTLAFFI